MQPGVGKLAVEFKVVFWTISFGAAGLLLVTWSMLLYEQEERIVGDVILSWWVSADDRANSVQDINRNISARVAATLGRWLDEVFGPSLISMNAVAASASLSLSSIALAEFVWSWSQLRGGYLIDVVIGTSTIATGLFYAAVSARTPNLKYVLLTLVFSFWFCGGLAASYRGEVSIAWFGVHTLAVLVLGIGADFAVVVIIRAVAVWVSRSATPSRLGLAMVTGLMIVLLIIVVPYWTAEQLYRSAGSPSRPGIAMAYLLAMAASNIYCGVIASSFVALPLGMIVNALIWPTTARMLYAAERFKLHENRKMLFFAGVSLIAVAAPKVAALFLHAATLLGH